MATLCLGNTYSSAPVLREWLGDNWALLFSHPADFQDKAVAHDRWLEGMRNEFRAHRVRPLACKPQTGEADLSWVGQLTYDHRMVRMDTVGSGDVVDLNAYELRDRILNISQRFVIFVDEALRLRGTFKYSPGHTNLSALDRLACVDAFRSQPCPARSRPAAPQALRVA